MGTLDDIPQHLLYTLYILVPESKRQSIYIFTGLGCTYLDVSEYLYHCVLSACSLFLSEKRGIFVGVWL
jgi:hypothetical protein